MFSNGYITDQGYFIIKTTRTKIFLWRIESLNIICIYIYTCNIIKNIFNMIMIQHRLSIHAAYIIM